MAHRLIIQRGGLGDVRRRLHLGRDNGRRCIVIARSRATLRRVDPILRIHTAAHHILNPIHEVKRATGGRDLWRHGDLLLLLVRRFLLKVVICDTTLRYGLPL